MYVEQKEIDPNDKDDYEGIDIDALFLAIKDRDIPPRLIARLPRFVREAYGYTDPKESD